MVTTDKRTGRLSEEERAFILDNITRMTRTEIARRLNREFSTVNMFCYRRGISQYAKPGRNRLTPERMRQLLEYLREHYGEQRPAAIAKRFGLATSTVQRLAQRLGLRWQEGRHGWYSPVDVAEMLFVDPKTIQKRCKRGEIAATLDGDVYRITRADLRAWLMDNAINLGARPVNLAAIIDIVTGGAPVETIDKWEERYL